MSLHSLQTAHAADVLSHLLNRLLGAGTEDHPVASFSPYPAVTLQSANDVPDNLFHGPPARRLYAPPRHFPGSLFRLFFHFPALLFFCRPLCQYLWREDNVSPGLRYRSHRRRFSLAAHRSWPRGSRAVITGQPHHHLHYPGLSRSHSDALPIFPEPAGFLRCSCSAAPQAGVFIAHNSSLSPIASSRPSRSVSGLSQIPAAFPFLSNAGSAVRLRVLFPGEMNFSVNFPVPDRTAAGLPGPRRFHPVALPARTLESAVSPPGRYGSRISMRRRFLR